MPVRLPQGPRHRERLRAAARPRRHRARRALARQMAERVRALCDRRAGIGGDGVLRVVRDGGRRWFMDYRNADGSLSEMCGNGIRVFARYLVEEGRPTGSARSRSTPATASSADRRRRPDHRRHGYARGARRDDGWRRAARAWAEHLGGAPRRHGQPARGRVRRPRRRRPAARGAGHDPAIYPDGVNVEFVVRRGERHVAMRVHERGSGETRSCGTGACAVMVAAAVAAGRPAGRPRTCLPRRRPRRHPHGDLDRRRPGPAHRPGRGRRSGHGPTL